MGWRGLWVKWKLMFMLPLPVTLIHAKQCSDLLANFSVWFACVSFRPHSTAALALFSRRCRWIIFNYCVFCWQRTSIRDLCQLHRRNLKSKQRRHSFEIDAKSGPTRPSPADGKSFRNQSIKYPTGFKTIERRNRPHKAHYFLIIGIINRRHLELTRKNIKWKLINSRLESLWRSGVVAGVWKRLEKFVLRISHEWSWLNWTWNEDSAKEAEEWVEGMLRKIIAGSRWLWDLIYQISIAYSSDKMDSTAPAPPLVLTHSRTFSATFAFEFIGFNYGPMVVTSHQLPEDGERLDMESGFGEEPSML